MMRFSMAENWKRVLTPFLAILLMGTAMAAAAQTQVTSLADDGGAGELRQVLANAPAGATITFASGLTGTINLTSELPAISQNVTIQGPGAANLTINGNQHGAVFSINSAVTASISGLTITGGNGGPSKGGGISDSGTLTLVNTTVTGNSASGLAGGILNSGTLTLINSTVSGNTAAGAGGIFSGLDGTLTLVNTTVTGNSASIEQGGIGFFGTMTLVNSVVEGNTAPVVPDLSPGQYTDAGGNLINNSSSATATPSLTPITNASGLTLYYVPLPGSPAICNGVAPGNTAPNNEIPSTDQRGVARPHSYGIRCYDSGAVQSDYSSVQFTNGASSSSNYSGTVNTAVATPAAPIVSVTEDGTSAGGVPITLAFSGNGTATGLGRVNTVAGTGATFGNLKVNASGLSDELTAGPIQIFDNSNGSYSLPAVTASLSIAYPTPTVTGVSPSSGSTVGGTSVTLTGTNFTGATMVDFGGVAATSFTVNSATSITAVSPAGSAGVVADVFVTNPSASSTTSLADQFTYIAPAVANAVSATVAYGSTNNPITLNISGGAATSVAVATQASHGTATASGTSITYTPTTGFAGSDSFTYTATNSVGTSAAATVTITVTAPTITVTPATLTAGTVGIAYSQTVSATGGAAPYAYSATGALPTGLTLMSGTLSGTPTAAGSYNFTITATDINTYTGSQAYSVVIGKTSSTTALAANPTTGVFGQSIILTATITSNNRSPSGTVAFSEGGTALSGCSAVSVTSSTASCMASTLSVATHSLTAAYSGDTNTTGSANATALPVVVSKAATSVTVTPLAAISLGQSVTVSASVAVTSPGAGTPTGTIAISDGGTVAGDTCAITLPATSCPLNPSSAGNLPLSATYSGDNDFVTSTNTASLSVGTATSAITLTSSPNPSTVGQAVTFTATVSAVTPASVGRMSGSAALSVNGMSGSAALSDNGTSGSTALSDNGMSGSTALSDNGMSGSAALSDIDVARAKDKTSEGASLFRPTAASGTPTGSVTFSENGAVLGTVALNASGVATYTTSDLSAGSQTITASYSGDANDAVATITEVQQVNSPPPPPTPSVPAPTLSTWMLALLGLVLACVGMRYTRGRAMH